MGRHEVESIGNYILEDLIIKVLGIHRANTNSLKDLKLIGHTKIITVAGKPI
jgi:hypothetical protein